MARHQYFSPANERDGLLMSEAEEIAAAMLPGYIAWRDAKYAAGKIGARPCDYVALQMNATESYNVMDAVTAALDKLAYPHS